MDPLVPDGDLVPSVLVSQEYPNALGRLESQVQVVVHDHGVRGRAVYRRQLLVPIVSSGLVWQLFTANVVDVLGLVCCRYECLLYLFEIRLASP